MNERNERNALLRDLFIAKDASYKNRISGYDEEPSGCLEGTRKDVLATLEKWARYDTINKIYWMYGMAGTGKSTIAHSLCERLQEAQLLGASFFCSRTSSTVSGTEYIIPTIASRIALDSPPFLSQILQQLDNDPELSSSKKPVTQFKHLISEPIKECFGSTNKTTYKVIVIDALDECTDIRKVGSLVKALLDGIPTLPIKLFIASREEKVIREAFTSAESAGSAHHHTFILHNVEEQIVKADIKLYLSESLSKIFGVNGYKSDPDLSTAVPLLVERAGQLFIYAATVVRDVGYHSGYHKKRLRSIIEDEGGSDSTLETAQLDSLYDSVLKRTFTGLKDYEVRMLREVLLSVVFSQNPISRSSMASLLGLQIEEVDYALDTLHSVVRVPSSPDLHVTPFHASFADFLQDAERCKSTSPLVPSECHSILATRSLRCLNETFELHTAPHKIEAAAAEQLEMGKNIEAVKYASLYWAHHLASSQFTDTCNN